MVKSMAKYPSSMNQNSDTSKRKGYRAIHICIDEETLAWLRAKLKERNKTYGIGKIIRELIEENVKLKEELKACRELLDIFP
jgi:hypothetical protein